MATIAPSVFAGLRQAAELSLADAATYCGVSFRQIEKFERGDPVPVRIRQALSTETLFTREPEASPENENFKFIDLFAGIGGIRFPFDSLGGECVFSSEWDRFAQKTYADNFGEVPHGDITKIASADIPDHDVLLAGFPCQAFSRAGFRRGFADTRGTTH
jgi:DNA (cytosine-5)-methyltransferase 1